jgi:hypothetical protein
MPMHVRSCTGAFLGEVPLREELSVTAVCFALYVSEPIYLCHATSLEHDP